MPRFEIKVQRRPVIQAPTFHAGQMQEIGEFAVAIIKERVAGGTDVFDKPAKPLQPKYALRKAKKGLPAIRDIRYTGNTLGSMQVIEVDDTHVKVGIRGVTPYKKALFNQNIDPWFGLSDTDHDRVFNEKVRPLFAQDLKDVLK